LKPLVVIFLSMCSLYMLVGGVVSLGAFKLMPTHGYGTLYEYRKANNGSSEIVKALIGQENINLIKQVRNQVAYLCIRNGFIMLLVSLLLLSTILTHNAYLNIYQVKKESGSISNDKGFGVVIQCNNARHTDVLYAASLCKGHRRVQRYTDRDEVIE